jgi:hypothetical protein
MDGMACDSCVLDGVTYYRVEINGTGRKKIISLPRGEDENDYEIFLATVEIRERLGCKCAAEVFEKLGCQCRWAAVKRSEQIIREADDWNDWGGAQIP